MLELRRQTAIDPCPAKEEEDLHHNNHHLPPQQPQIEADDVVDTTSSSYGGAVTQWPGMKYACLKVIQAYCKVFDQQDLYDLIVRYIQQINKEKLNLYRP